MGKPIQILTQSGNGLRLTAQISEVYRILDSIGDKRVAVISINGNKRTGKSFMLNYFLRYLTRNHRSGIHCHDWVYGNGDAVLAGFDWRGGVERHTVGIWMWSEPYMVKASDGSDVALLLLDTQGSFDQQTTFQECAVIFSLSALLSATMIMNLKNDVSEDKLQFLEFFTYFADQSFSESNQTVDGLCEKLVFLVRDWEFKSSYQFGCHNDFSPEKKNFKKDFIDPNSDKQCLEAQHTRHQIIKHFKDVSSFLLPHPGLKVTKSTFRGQNELIDKEFLDYVRLFVPIILDSANICVKRIGGNCLTGTLLKVYLKKWSQIIESKQYPDAKTLTKITSDVNCMISFNEALSLYENKIRSFFALNLTRNELFAVHREAYEESVIHFNTKVNNNNSSNSSTSDEMIEELPVKLIGIYELYDANNNNRIDREVRDETLNLVLIDQIDMQNRLDQQKCSQQFLMNELREQFTQEIEETKKREIESELRLIEENARLEEELVTQKMENLRIIAEREENNRKELTEIESRNKRRMNEMLANIRSYRH